MFIFCILFSESHAFFQVYLFLVVTLLFYVKYEWCDLLFKNNTENPECRRHYSKDTFFVAGISLNQIFSLAQPVSVFGVYSYFKWWFLCFISGSAGNKEDILESRPRKRKHQNPETKEKGLMWNHFVCLNIFLFMSGTIYVVI